MWKKHKNITFASRFLLVLSFEKLYAAVISFERAFIFWTDVHSKITKVKTKLNENIILLTT